MIDFPLLLFGVFMLMAFLIVERFGACWRWVAGCLISVILLPIVGIGLVLLHDFLINL